MSTLLLEEARPASEVPTIAVTEKINTMARGCLPEWASGGVLSEKQQIAMIIKTVAKMFNLSPAALKSKSRPKSLVDPRHLAMVMCRRLTKATITTIGKEFRHDHSLVSYAAKRFQHILETEEYWARCFKEAERRIIEELSR
jgi:chromosomal replication initiation ATPase DnaA